MAKRILWKIRRVGKGPYSGQFDCRRGDVILLPKGEAQRLLRDFPDEFKRVPVNTKVAVYAQKVKDPAEGEDAMEIEELEE